jgi:prepilin-type N-terminal cleavage/methylation domain-containing protein
MGRKGRGFSLTELSISLAIIGVVAGSAMSVLLTGDYRAKKSQTDLKMERVRDAVAAFLSTYGRIPCPAVPVLKRADPEFGKEIVADASNYAEMCDDGSGALHSNVDGVFVGAVPVATLGLPHDYVADGWGNRFLYVVDGSYVLSDTQNPNCSYALATPPCFVLGSGATKIEIRGAGGTPKSDKAVYALVSFGQNGHGAYTGYGSETRVQAYSEDSPYYLPNSDELENAELDTADADAYQTSGFDAVLVQKPLVDKREEADKEDREYFDDVVLFRTKRQLIADVAGDETESVAEAPKLFDADCLYAEEVVEEPTANRCTGAADYDACQKFAVELEERCL